MPEVTKKKPLKPKTVIKKSPIHGKGLFAAEEIAKDQYIGTYKGPVTQEDDIYVLWIEDEDGEVYGIDGQNKFKYVNHSTSNNAMFYGPDLYAVRKIKAGEEIFHHYGEDWADGGDV